MYSLTCTHGYAEVYSCNLLFDPTRPIFVVDKDIRPIRSNTLTNFLECWTENVAFKGSTVCAHMTQTASFRKVPV